MPSKRNRRRRASDRRRATDAAPARYADAPRPPPDEDDRPPLPSLRIRYAGFALALITVMIAAFTIADAVSGDLSGIELVIRVATGIALGVLAFVIAALALVPERVRAWLRRE